MVLVAKGPKTHYRYLMLNLPAQENWVWSVRVTIFQFGFCARHCFCFNSALLQKKGSKIDVFSILQKTIRRWPLEICCVIARPPTNCLIAVKTQVRLSAKISVFFFQRESTWYFIFKIMRLHFLPTKIFWKFYSTTV